MYFVQFLPYTIRIFCSAVCKLKLKMADDELEAIRRQRMSELQAKHGVRRETRPHLACPIKGDARVVHAVMQCLGALF